MVNAWFAQNALADTYIDDGAEFDRELFAGLMAESYAYFKKFTEAKGAYRSYPIDAIEVLLQIKEYTVKTLPDKPVFAASQAAAMMLLNGAMYEGYMPEDGVFEDDLGMDLGGEKLRYAVEEGDLSQIEAIMKEF